MRRHRPVSWTVVLVLLLACVSMTHAQEPLATITYLEGDVSVRMSDVTSFADFGTELGLGDLVIAGADGLAIVELHTGAEVKLRANTTIAIADLVDGAAVDLQSGSVFARVAESALGRRNFEIRARTVVAGVRGTEFFVAFGRTIEDAPDLWLCVNDGSVEVRVDGSDDATLVNAGEGINVLAGRRTTDPRFYAWTTELNWNFDTGAGSVLDETDLDAAYSDLLDQDYD